jgi:hypothetical protein
MKPILNLYANKRQALQAFEKCRAEGKYYKAFSPCMRIETFDSLVYFMYYTSYENARHNELCQVWGEINFFVELPENVRLHYLSRIRWVKPE